MKHLTLALALTLAACGGSDAEEAPGRRVAIEVSSTGYEPSEVTASVGERITLAVTRVSEEGCGEVLVIESQGIREDLPLNEEVRVTFTPTEAGRLRFSCGMDMYDGAIVVTE